MEFEQAINFVKSRQNHECSSEISQNWGGVEECLEEGKKWKAIFNELEKGKYMLLEFDKDGYYKKDHRLSDIKQKYFPKPTKKTITIEIEGDDGRELFCQFIKGKDLIEKHFQDERRRGRQGIFSNFDVCGEKVQVIIKDKEGD